jgi:hypothetical protein
VGIRVNNPEVLDQLEKYFPPGWKPAVSPVVDRLYSLKVGGSSSRPGVRYFHLLYGNVVRLARTADIEELFTVFESDLQLYVAEVTRHRLFVHAGVVGWKGVAILIPGLSFSGKTTLVSELVRAGATYYSDEYAVLDRHGRVHPYPRALLIRQNGNQKSSKCPIERLGGVAGRKPLPVGLVVVSHYRAGSRWRPRQLPEGRGVLALLANTVSARRQPKTALSTLEHVASRAPVLKGARGEAKEVVDSILHKANGGRPLISQGGSVHSKTNSPK